MQSQMSKNSNVSWESMLPLETIALVRKFHNSTQELFNPQYRML